MQLVICDKILELTRLPIFPKFREFPANLRDSRKKNRKFPKNLRARLGAPGTTSYKDGFAQTLHIGVDTPRAIGSADFSGLTSTSDLDKYADFIVAAISTAVNKAIPKSKSV